MNRQQAIEILAKLKPELIKRFGVTRLALFGSTVRNEVSPDSDSISLWLLMARLLLKDISAFSFFWKTNWVALLIW